MLFTCQGNFVCIQITSGALTFSRVSSSPAGICIKILKIEKILKLNSSFHSNKRKTMLVSSCGSLVSPFKVSQLKRL